MNYFVYVIKSEIDGRLYKGMTSDLEGRIKSHNKGKVTSTKAFRPWRLVYHEILATQHEARERELFFKSGIGREFLKSLNL
jgi:putative endonuclease